VHSAAAEAMSPFRDETTFLEARPSLRGVAAAPASTAAGHDRAASRPWHAAPGSSGRPPPAGAPAIIRGRPIWIDERAAGHWSSF